MENSEIKVMIVDDSPTIRKSANMFLTKAGYQVILAEDGFEALTKVIDEEPHIIFIDIMMPRLDGYNTCQLIKKNEHFKETPIIMLSSKDGVIDKAKGRIVGSDEYLTKPFSKENLLNAVQKHLDK